MRVQRSLLLVLITLCSPFCLGDEPEAPKPIELEVLKASVGVWDAEYEIWPQGPNSPSIKFQGSETNRAFGEYWIDSDLVSKFGGETMIVHSIVGYDIDQKKLVGMIIDHGPYSATMTGVYDPKSKSVTWTTKAKYPNGKPMTQKATVTHTSADERTLVLEVPDKNGKNDVKFMQIKYARKKKKGDASEEDE